MARTPLFDLFLRSLRALEGEKRTGVPAEELLERAALRRREVLALGAGAALLAGCAPKKREPTVTPPVTPAKKSPEIAVVGGGIAGLHCAHRLRKLGVSTRVYEASAERFGGRMFSDRKSFGDGMHCELGGELIDTSHQTMRDLAQELSIDLYDYKEDDASLAKMVAFVDGKKLLVKDLLKGFAPIAKKIDEARKALKDPEGYVTYKDPNGAEGLDALSITAWFDKAGIPAKDKVRRLLELAYEAELGLHPSELSSLGFLQVVSSSSDHFEIFGESDERFHTKSGNDTFIQKLVEGLQGQPLELGARLVAIANLTDGRYLLTFDRAGKTEEVKADHVVLALPFSLLREVKLDVPLSEQKKKAISELGYGTNAKLMTGYEEKVWRSKHKSDGSTFADVGYHLSWETSRLQPGTKGIITNFTGAKLGVDLGQGTADEQAKGFVEKFDKVFPGAKAAFNGEAARMHWPSYPLTKGSYASYKVGQYTAFCGAEIERAGNLHFCGEHTSLDAQGFMEGGALTGAMAAKEVAGDLGVAVTEAMGPGARILERAELAHQGGRWTSVMAKALRRRRTG